KILVLQSPHKVLDILRCVVIIVIEVDNDAAGGSFNQFVSLFPKAHSVRRVGILNARIALARKIRIGLRTIIQNEPFAVLECLLLKTGSRLLQKVRSTKGGCDDAHSCHCKNPHRKWLNTTACCWRESRSGLLQPRSPRAARRWRQIDTL